MPTRSLSGTWTTAVVVAMTLTWSSCAVNFASNLIACPIGAVEPVLVAELVPPLVDPVLLVVALPLVDPVLGPSPPQPINASESAATESKILIILFSSALVRHTQR